MLNLRNAGAAAFLAAGILSSPAQAADGLKNLSFSAEAVDKMPALVFQEKDGKYVLGKGGPQSTIKFRLKAEKKGGFRIHEYWIFSVAMGKDVTHPQGFSVKKLDKTITHQVQPEELQAFVQQGRQFCKKGGDAQQAFAKTVKPGLKYTFAVKAKKKKITGEYDSELKYVKASVPVRIICKPEPFKVIGADLSVTFDGPPYSCPVQATLTAKFKTNKPGTFKFNLYRGDGAVQTVTRTAGKKKVVIFSKQYTFNKPANRKYLVAAIPAGASTGWVPMKVQCNGNTGGLQTAPKPHNN